MDFRQAGFQGGEVSPSLYGRTDDPHIQLGLRLCNNWLITPHGAAVSRPGSVYVAETKFSGASTVRLVKFMVAAGTSFVLEFGAGYIRFHQNGAPVLSGGVPYQVATPYAAADLFRLKFAQSGDIMTIVHPGYAPQDLTRLGTTSWTLAPCVFSSNGAFVPSGGLVNICANSAANWSAITTYAAGTYATYTAGGTGYVYMSLGDGNLNNTPNPAGPTAWWVPCLDSSHPTRTWEVVVTVVFRDANGVVRETMPQTLGAVNYAVYIDRPARYGATLNGLDSTINPIAVNFYRGRNGLFGLLGSSQPSFSGGQWVAFYNDDGAGPDYTTGPPQGIFPFQVAPSPPQWSFAISYLIGNQVMWQSVLYTALLNNSALRPDSNPANWTPSPGWASATTYGARVYAVWQGLIYYSLQAGNTNHQPDISPTWWQPAWTYPATVTYYEQRLVFGGAGPVESAVALSATGQFRNFDNSSTNTNPAQPLNPSKPSSSLLFYLASRERDQIRSIVGLRSLLVMTSLGEWSMRGSQGAPLTSTSFDAKIQSRRGSSWLDPIVSGNIILFNMVQGSRVRDLVYNFYADSYSGKDVSTHADHLLRNHSIVDWAYASVPYSIAFMVRDDGVLLGLTYQNAPATDFEQDDKIDAWHWHSTLGTYESVCVVQEGSEDAVYVVCLRQGRRFVERFATRVVSDVRTFVGSDQAVLWDGRNATATTVTASGGTTWNGGDVGTLTASAGTFAAGDVGSAVMLDANGTLYATTGPSAVPDWDGGATYTAGFVVKNKGLAYFSLQGANVNQPPGNPASNAWWAPANGPFSCTVTAYTSATQVSVIFDRAIPPALRGVASTLWGWARTSFTLPSTLWAGQQVNVLADGLVQAQNSPAGTTLTLSDPAMIVVAGLPIVARLETLDLSSPKLEVRSKVKTTVRGGMETELSGSLQVGNTFDGPTAAPFVTWTPRQISDPNYGGPTQLFTGFDQAYVKDRYDKPGRVAFMLVDPLPSTLVSVSRDMDLGGST